MSVVVVAMAGMILPAIPLLCEEGRDISDQRDRDRQTDDTEQLTEVHHHTVHVAQHAQYNPHKT